MIEVALHSWCETECTGLAKSRLRGSRESGQSAKGFENGVCSTALDGQCSIDVELGYGRQQVQHKISKDY